MSGYWRAVRPLDDAAVSAANAAVAPETGGRPIRMDEFALRRKWMAAYEKAGGKVEFVDYSGKKPKDTCETCKPKKSVTARIISVTFLSDHLGGGAKLIKRAVPEHIKVKRKTGVNPTTGTETFVMEEVDSVYGDGFTDFMKPEWDVARGGSADSHPISHTKDQNVQIKVEIEITFTPEGESGTLTRVTGTGSDLYLSFEKSLSKTVTTQRIEVTGLVSKGKLPNFVTRLDGSIDWKVEIDGEEKSIGMTSTHVIYVTFDKPFGKMGSPTDNAFAEIDADQIVTEDRLKYSVTAADHTGSVDEQECVDAIFVNLMKLHVGYVLDRRWEHAPNNTGVLPKPTLHHYLWLCDAAIGQGECHNIAAAMALACRILGVKGAFEVGYMYPWPSRAENHPTYSKSSLTTSSGKSILGKYNERYSRDHSKQSGHGNEVLGFLDGRGFGNNFEGVVAYKKTALYAIGDDVFDTSSTDANENATSYYADRVVSAGIRRTINDWNKGAFDLTFWDPDSGANCFQPYPWLTTVTTFPSGEKHVTFRWED